MNIIDHLMNLCANLNDYFKICVINIVFCFILSKSFFLLSKWYNTIVKQKGDNPMIKKSWSYFFLHSFYPRWISIMVKIEKLRLVNETTCHCSNPYLLVDLFLLSIMNAGNVPLCVLAGMILYELKKMNSKDK